MGLFNMAVYRFKKLVAWALAFGMAVLIAVGIWYIVVNL